jgi:hypothetical protein
MKNAAPMVLAICLVLGIWPCRAEQPYRPGQDNLLIDVSGALLNALAPAEINETQTERDVVSDIPITSSTRIRASAQAALVPAANYGVVDVLLNGNSLTQLQARLTEPDLIIYATARTAFVARKRIYVSAAGLGSFPAQASATSALNLDKVTTPQGDSESLLPSLAEGVFALRQSRLERTISQKGEAQLKRQIEEQAGPRIAQGNKAFKDTLSRIRADGIPLRQLSFSTTSSVLTVHARIAITDTPPGPAPPLPGPFELGVRFHQSAVNEGAQAALAGKTISANDLSTLPGGQRTARAHLAHAMLDVLAHEPFGGVALTFADQQPLVVVFADHSFSILLNVKELRTASIRLPGLKVKAVYKFVNAPGRVTAVRQGRVEITPYYGHKIGGHAIAALLEHRMNTIFDETIPFPEVNPPTPLNQIGTLIPVFADTDHGWLTATWVRKGRMNN